MTFLPPKSPKLGNTRKKFCLKPIPTNHTNKKYTIFSPCLCVEISVLIGQISRLIITDLLLMKPITYMSIKKNKTKMYIFIKTHEKRV